MKVLKNILFGFIISLFIVLVFSKCKTQHGKSPLWSVKMAQSEINRNPPSWVLNITEHTRWGYMQGVLYKALLDMWKYTGDSIYLNKVIAYGEYIINDEGEIKGYELEKYSTDDVNAGKILFDLYEITGDEKYKIALTTLRNQIETHPRTKEGGFWHKGKYTHQMWLDGIYMINPFLAQYAKVFNEPQLFDEVVNQIEIISKHTFDPTTNLNYHGWDESKTQLWANKETGCSENFWGRGQGWYAMALVDVLDYLPDNHPGRQNIIIKTKLLAKGITEYADEKNGLWYQVINFKDSTGNYIESSCSAMFVYFLYKAVRKGYIDEKYKNVALKGYNGILKELIRHNEDGTISIIKSCAVAGLGGKGNRDGSFAYYISERKTDTDPKAIGPFIWASIEHEIQ